MPRIDESSAGECRWGELTFASEELAFRNHHLETTRRLTVLAIAATSALILLNVRNDVLLASSPRELALEIGIRVVNVLAGVAVAVLALRSSATVRLERATILWIALTIASKFAVLAMRPRDYHAHIPADIVFLVVALLILPISFRAQLASMAAFAVADLVIALGFREPMSAAAALSTAFSYVLVMLLGAIATHRMQTTLRHEFSSLRRESAARESLESALAEVRTLRGILPICASCHDIRDDEGYWHRVEVYVREHTHADFTHGICPKCVRKLYPKVADEVLRRVASPAPRAVRDATGDGAP